MTNPKKTWAEMSASVGWPLKDLMDCPKFEEVDKMTDPETLLKWQRYCIGTSTYEGHRAMQLVRLKLNQIKLDLGVPDAV